MNRFQYQHVDDEDDDSHSTSQQTHQTRRHTIQEVRINQAAKLHTHDVNIYDDNQML